MRIDTQRPEMPVHGSPSGESVQLGIEMVLHALGLEVARIKERQRHEAAEQARLARVILDTEVHQR